MAISKKKNESKMEMNIKVTRAREFENAIAFDMEVNGVTIYGCWYRTYKDKKSGEEKALISFPSTKSAKDNKYYNHVYFYVTDEHIKTIEKQIEDLL